MGTKKSFSMKLIFGVRQRDRQVGDSNVLFVFSSVLSVHFSNDNQYFSLEMLSAGDDPENMSRKMFLRIQDALQKVWLLTE